MRDALGNYRVKGVPRLEQFFWLKEKVDARERRPVLVMEKINGITLQELRKTKPKFLLPLGEAITLLRAITVTLSAVHQRGIIHGDLKLGNIVVQPNGAVALLDWGTAVVLEKQPPARGPVIGTMQFISYEQLTKQTLDARADIYALGMIMGLLVYGDGLTPRYYYDEKGKMIERNSEATADAVEQKETLKYDRLPPPQSPTEERWQQLLCQMTQWDRSRRPKNLTAVIAAIR